MRDRILNRSIYFLLIATFLFTCSVLIFLYPQGRSFFILNGLNFSALDILFPYLTHLGDGITSIVICILLLVFYNFGSGIISAIGLSLCGLISHIMKFYLFDLSPRPHHFFWGNKMIHYVDGIKINIENSFPSGHSFTAFFIFTFLAMLSIAETKFIQFLLAALAISAAYSRVYLAQHFVGDILAGALLGSFIAILFYKIYIKSKNIKFLNNNLIRLIKK